MKKFLRFAPLLMIISCANVQSNTVDGNGVQTHTLTCSEFNDVSLERCKNQAKELCANDYHLVAQHKEVSPDAGDGFYMPPKHHLSIQCKI
ncbi:MAG: hypothetical protein B7Y48_11310 [Methylophilales bacterium 28-44-11]|nr:MAG: hypothetical protein B7Y48_11310 [Methylophilales bacterium 28-44-11]OYZ06041.1 MAG: hypothetical protein B7Y32_03330 [Methylophilales bacterium 16-45-7]